MRTILSLLGFLFCALAWTSGQEFDEDSEYADALFRAAATPEGSLLIAASGEYATATHFYEARTVLGEEVEFATDAYHTWTSEVGLEFGVLEDLELSVLIPIVSESWQAAPTDRFSQIRSRDSVGLGDIELAASYGFESEDETLLGIVTVGAGLPTNNLDPFFGGKTTSGFAFFEAEKFWGPLGVAGELGVIYEEGEFDPQPNWMREYRAGLIYIPIERLEFTASWFREDEIDAIELGTEYLFSERFSIEFFGAHELNGDENQRSIGMGVNVIFGDD